MLELIDREVTLQLLDKSIELFGENTLQDRMSKNGLLAARRIVSKQPTIEADIDRAAILRLCNEIEEIVTAIANWSENWQTVDDCRTVCDKLKEIGKELTGDAGKTD